MEVRDGLFRWIEDTRSTFARLGVTAVDPERFLPELTDRLRAVFEAQDDELLTLPEAAHRTGYSADHVGRLVREGVIPNAGVPNRPRVRAADLASLPRRASRSRAFATAAHGSYDPHTDARALLSRRGGTRT